jgi:hypothetical protein
MPIIARALSVELLPQLHVVAITAVNNDTCTDEL